MNWPARQAVDLWRRVARWYYVRKYRVLARHLDRPLAPLEPQRGPGFILIQIDGLSHAHLRLALEQGLMPHVRQMLETRQARLNGWRCGLPSTTPAVQAALVYGDKFDIPGFRWYDKERRVSIEGKRPDQIRAMAQRLRGEGRGLLHGGSSYTNFFDGDAALSLFTMSTLGTFHLFENVRGIGFALLFLLSPVRIARIVYHSVREYLRDLVQRAIRLFRPGRIGPGHLLAPLYRIVVDVLFGELETFAMLLDMYLGVPSLLANFTSYDELAHHWGPAHSEALRSLRRIDAQIHQVDRMRRIYRHRDYDLYILSDHGMSDSDSFQSRYGTTLGRFILDSVGQPLALDEYAAHENQSLAKARFLMDELQAWEHSRYRGPHTARTVRLARALLDQRIPSDLEQAAFDPARRGDIVVRPSGGLAHVYFNLSSQRLNLSEIVWLYPDLAKRLLEHPGIGLVVGRQDGQVVLMGSAGTRVIPAVAPGAPVGEPGGGPDDEQRMAQDLAELASYPHSGDLMLLGAWDEDGRVVTFEEQRGTHGGVGGAQERPFIISPSSAPLDPRALNGPRDLYVHFMANYVTARRMP